MWALVKKYEPRLPRLRADVNQNRRSKWGGIHSKTNSGKVQVKVVQKFEKGYFWIGLGVGTCPKV